MYDIISVGGASVDVLVKAKEMVKKHKDHFDISYHLGEKVLIDDLIFTTGGGGTNTAVAFSRLGLKTGFIGVVGADVNGEMILKELFEEGVDFLGNVKNGKTGYSVILTGHDDRTILTYKGVNNDLSWSNVYLHDLKTRWLYISTMLGESFKTVKKLAAHASKNKIKVVCNLSPYLAKKGIKELASFLKNIDVLIINKEECIALAHKSNVKNAIKAVKKYVNEIVVVTDSFKPALAFDGKEFYVKNIKRIRPIDSTGAGDAFASGFVYGFINRKPISLCLDYGCREALAVIKHIGAKNNLLRKL